MMDKETLDRLGINPCTCTGCLAARADESAVVDRAEVGAYDPIDDEFDDPVCSPKHYTALDGIDCVDVIRHFNFNRGNAIKYIWRAGLKDETKTIEDLQKAIWYLNDEIEMLEIEMLQGMGNA